MSQDVVLVTVDSWRADAIERMPVLQSLSNQWSSTDAIAQTTATYGAFAPIHASQYYPQVYDTDGNVVDAKTLAAVLSDNGYSTAGFVASNPYLNRWSESFDTFWNDDLDVADSSDSALQSVVRKGRRMLDLVRMRDRITATDLFDRAEQWWVDVQGPRFLWMHLMDTHEPYLPTLRCLSQPHTAHYSTAKFYLNRWSLDEKTMRGIKRLYDDTVTYLDKQMSEFTRFLNDDPIVVITGDHGEAFDHGMVAHAQIYEETARVPYLTTLNQSEENPVRHLDIAPTIVDALGLPLPDRWEGSPVDGTYRDSFLMNMSTELNETFLGIRTDSHKLIQRYNSSTGKHLGTELYNFTEDPNERVPVDDKEPEVRKNLEERIEAFLSRDDIDWNAMNCRPISLSSKAAEERLKSLGYM